MRILRLSVVSCFLAAPSVALAANSVTIFGSGTPLLTIIGNIVNVGVRWIGGLAGSVFLIGAFWMVINAANETEAAKGKNIMRDALIGLGAVLLSYAFIRLVLYIFFV